MHYVCMGNTDLQIKILKQQIKQSKGVVRDLKIEELEKKLIKKGEILEGEFATEGVDF